MESLFSKERLVFVLSKNRYVLAGWLISIALCALVLYLYQAPLEGSLLYGILSGLVLIAWLTVDGHVQRRVLRLLQADSFEKQDYPVSAQPYLARIEAMQEENRQEKTAHQHERDELRDYFSLWAHQVKLPIAAMDLQLQLPDPSLGELSSCLARMNESVESAMAFVRLDSSDFRFRLIDLEACARKIIRDHASILIGRRMQPAVESDGSRVPSDSKWVQFVLGQLLSNSVKYAPDGTKLTIRVEKNSLSLADEGPGIPEEDLPRIFEKGFTGANGHANASVSSGLGLYLCDQICRRLRCTLTIANRQDGCGTIARIEFPLPQNRYD